MDKLFGNMRPARQHHYVFAHLALRHICLENPWRFFAIMGSEQAREFVNDIWEMVDHQCEQDTDLSAQDIEFYTMRIGNFPTLVFKMQEPVAITEAHLVAIVLKHDINTTPTSQEVEIAYYTLEHGITLDGQPRTVLCEWSAKGHNNYGDGPQPGVVEFLEVIRDRILPMPPIEDCN